MASGDRRNVHFAPLVRTHSEQGSGFEPLAEEPSRQPEVTTHGSRRNTYLTPPWATASSLGSATGFQGGNMYAAPGTQATAASASEETYIHPLLMGGLSQVDMRTEDSLATRYRRLREAAFPITWDRQVRLHLSVHGTTILWWSFDSKNGQPLSVREVLDAIRTALQTATVLPPGHPLTTTVSAACARRRGRTPRMMDFYGPADKLLLMRLVRRTDAFGAVYYDVDLVPWSRSRA